MIKTYILLLLLAVNASHLLAQAPTPVGRMIDRHYRSDPFKSSFSGFLQHLMTDPEIIEPQKTMRTDTTLFAFLGKFKAFKSFEIDAKRTEVSLQEVSVQFSPSDPKADTLYLYEVATVIENTPSNKTKMLRLFDKLHRKNARDFFDSNYREETGTGGVAGGRYNYFLPFNAFAPISLMWGTTGDSKELFIAITLRFDVEENEAVLPVPLDRP